MLNGNYYIRYLNLVLNLRGKTFSFSPFSMGRYLREGTGYPLHYSSLGNSMDRGAGWATVHGVAKRHDWATNTLLFTSYNSAPVIRSDQIRSVAQSCPTLCDPMNCSTPGLPVHHQLSEFTETHILRVNDAIQPSHPLSSPSPPAPNPSQHELWG